MTDLEFHPIAGIFPLVEGEEFDSIVADVRTHGIREPIWLYDGKILDGRNRYRAARLVGVEFGTRSFAGTALEAIEFVWSLNRTRRHLSSSQAAIADAKRDRMTSAYAPVREAAKQRQVDAGKEFGRGKVVKQIAQAIADHPSTTQGAGRSTPPKKKPAQKTRQIRAKAAGTNATYIDLADKLIDERPDLAAEVEAGRKTLTQVHRDLRREEAVAKLESIQVKQAKEVEGVYDVIVIDPPWPMEKIERDVRPNQAAFDYPRMSEDEIAAVPIPAADDCHVWVWTTHRFLPMALRLIEKWGLKYVCTFTWHKPGGFQPVGLPQFNSEFAIYARKGTPIFLTTKDFPTCFCAPRGEHSEKPERFYEIVRRVTGGRRLDMFNRRPIDGFDVWGNEAAAAE